MWSVLGHRTDANGRLYRPRALLAQTNEQSWQSVLVVLDASVHTLSWTASQLRVQPEANPSSSLQRNQQSILGHAHMAAGGASSVPLGGGVAMAVAVDGR